MHDFAKHLRNNSTASERHLWRYLKNRQINGTKFRRQQRIGNYIVDFVSFEKNIIIELDGGQHTIFEKKDKIRDKWLEEEGYKVLRFWDNDVFRNIGGVLERILEEM